MSAGLGHFDFTSLVADNATGACRRVVNAGTVLFCQGDPADSVYYLVSGKIKLSAVSVQGREAIITISEPDEFFGENCLLNYDTRRMTAVALDDSCVVKIRKEVARAFMHDNVRFAQFLITRLIKSALRTEDQLLDQLFHSSERRLARALLLLANFAKKDAQNVTMPKVNQETLAELVGSTRPRINQFMNKFRKLGYIDYDGSTITVHRSLLTAARYEAKNREIG